MQQRINKELIDELEALKSEFDWMKLSNQTLLLLVDQLKDQVFQYRNEMQEIKQLVDYLLESETSLVRNSDSN